MDINTVTIYWIMKLDDIIDLLVIVVVGIMAFLACYGPYLHCFADLDIEEMKGKLKKQCKIWIPVIIALIIGCAFIPSTKQMAAIYILPKIANSTVINDTSKIYKLGIDYINSELVGVKDR